MDQENTFNKFERAVLDSIIERNEDANLVAQVKAAQFVKRDWTRIGFFVTLNVPKDTAPIETSHANGPWIESPDIEFGGGAVLLAEGGHITTLEMYAHGSFFNENISEFKLSW